MLPVITRRGGPNATGKTSSSRNIVQYAVLNLASLHFRFGHMEMALAAINETVRIAQQNGDHVCVAFSLAWLHQLLARTGVGGRTLILLVSRLWSDSRSSVSPLSQDLQAEEVLLRCIGRASEQSLRHLESIATLSLASYEAVPRGVLPGVAALAAADNVTAQVSEDADLPVKGP